ncbi:MAG TPA: metallophosphoesterase [Candidatus Methanofastidiosa archaeon]|nr:metallophosphoesterase [Candidatus Methanofastidiosa archaeon]HPR42401.1 metallophosphoesterase [Candidatus Methanofastidiosa archaeon]
MSYDAYPIPDVPALMIEGEERTLVIADLHLGYEYELLRKGINLPNQAPLLGQALRETIKGVGAERLIFLGDIKHNIPIISALESKSLPKFMDFDIPFDIIKGNHDGNIENLLGCPSNNYILMGNVLLTHGHMKMPEVDFELLVTGHSHPAIEITDELGRRTKEKCWIRGKFPSGQDIIIMPAYNPLITGISVNHKGANIPGTLFKRFSADELDLTAYLLDGTFLGNISAIR